MNLSELAIGFVCEARVSSRYKRLQRFFRSFQIDQTVVARWLFRLFFSPDQAVYLTLDRTNWYWGKRKINIFMLAVAYEGIAIPLFWTYLPKAGNSSVKEQKIKKSA